MVLSEERVPESGMMGKGRDTFQAAEAGRPDGASGCLEDASRTTGQFSSRVKVDVARIFPTGTGDGG